MTITIVTLVFPLVVAAMTPAQVLGARARARMYEETTGHKVSAWDIYWGGNPPTQDLGVRLETTGEEE